jgi:nucleoside-diphosphate-sugar epimerase
MTPTLLSLGHGYSASALARRLQPQGWRVIGTTRSPDRADQGQRREVGLLPAAIRLSLSDLRRRTTNG